MNIDKKNIKENIIKTNNLLKNQIEDEMKRIYQEIYVESKSIEIQNLEVFFETVERKKINRFLREFMAYIQEQYISTLEAVLQSRYEAQNVWMNANKNIEIPTTTRVNIDDDLIKNIEKINLKQFGNDGLTKDDFAPIIRYLTGAVVGGIIIGIPRIPSILGIGLLACTTVDIAVSGPKILRKVTIKMQNKENKINVQEERKGINNQLKQLLMAQQHVTENILNEWLDRILIIVGESAV